MRSVSLSRRPSWPASIALCAVAWVALASCGGGGGGGAPEDPTQGEFSGTAAVGAPIAGGTLELRCASGTRSASTGPDGRYRVELEKSLQLPCVVFVRGGTVGGRTNGESLAGVLLRTGTVANVTPWTHLITARLLGGEPNNVLRAISSTELTRVLTDDRLAAARAFVREQLAKVLGNSPSEDIDPIGTAFEAVPGNGMDDLVVAIAAGLAEGGKTMTLAAQEMALAGLEMYFVPKVCRAGVLSGFTGRFDDVLVQAAYRPPSNGGLGGADSYGGTAEGDTGGGGEGAGVGGSLGQFLRTKVEVRRADGSLLGTATTDNDKGMVTLVTCDYRGPLRITLRGERDDATYYDESRKINVSFAGRSMCAVLPGRSRNIGVTPLTNAACAYLDELVKTRLPTAGRAAWADEALIDKANAAALKAYNDNAGPNFRLDDITRLPVVIGQSLDQQQDVLGFNPNGIYAAVLAGLVQSAGRYDPDAPAPALALTDQLARDLSDGALDHVGADGQSAFAGATPTYLVDQMPNQVNSNVTGNAQRLGSVAMREAGNQIVKHVAIPQYHQDQDPAACCVVVFTEASVDLAGDGRITVQTWPRDEPNNRKTIRSPENVRFVDFRVVDMVLRGPMPSPTSPTKIVAFTDDGSVHTLSARAEYPLTGPPDWIQAFGAQSRVVDVLAAPSAYAQKVVTLTSNGEVRGDEIESKLPVGQRYEGLAELSLNAFLLVDADRRLHTFYADINRFVPSGTRGRYALMTPFAAVRTKMVGGRGALDLAYNAPSPVATGSLLVLDLLGKVWHGPVSVDPGAAPALRLDGLQDVCYVHSWYAVQCDGTLLNLHRPTSPVIVRSEALLPGLSRAWRVFREPQSEGTQEVVRALTYDSCIYIISYQANAGSGPSGDRWVVNPVFAGTPRPACVSADWVRAPGPVTIDP
ncbi:MAG: hypothetical protein HZC37_04845 [Burkholderiales bacterium]|nr:hypothetical protein [Burkholderiales bacterium]